MLRVAQSQGTQENRYCFDIAEESYDYFNINLDNSFEMCMYTYMYIWKKQNAHFHQFTSRNLCKDRILSI